MTKYVQFSANKNRQKEKKRNRGDQFHFGAQAAMF